KDQECRFPRSLWARSICLLAARRVSEACLRSSRARKRSGRAVWKVCPREHLYPATALVFRCLTALIEVLPQTGHFEDGDTLLGSSMQASDGGFEYCVASFPTTETRERGEYRVASTE